MAKPQPSKTGERAQGVLDSALRTLELEGSGVEALATALRNGLGVAFTAAIDMIGAAQGRVIVTGMGKSGHVGHKIASTFASTGTPALFVHPAEAGHGDLGMITKNDVILALSWSGETAELKNLTDYSQRHKIGLIAMTASPESTLAKTADVVLDAAAGARGLPAQSGADHLGADAARARRRAGDRALGKPRLHRDRFRPAASRRQARRAAQDRARSHAYRRVGAAQAARHADVGRHHRDDHQGLRLRRHYRCARSPGRHHHRRRLAPRTCATTCSMRASTR